jgi:hypothetical protein
VAYHDGGHTILGLVLSDALRLRHLLREGWPMRRADDRDKPGHVYRP